MLCVDGAYTHRLLVNHLHDLPLTPVLGGTAELAASEGGSLSGVRSVLLRELCPDKDTVRVADKVVDAVQDGVAHLCKLLLGDHLAQILQYGVLIALLLLPQLFVGQLGHIGAKDIGFGAALILTSEDLLLLNVTVNEVRLVRGALVE